MRDAYDVSHLYDETGSAKARHHEALLSAERRRLVGELRRSGQGLHQRALAGLSDILGTFADRVSRAPETLEPACSQC